jgi:hypothetical protein
MVPFTSWHWVITSHIGVPNLADVFFSVPQGSHVRLEHRLIGWWIFCLGSATAGLCYTLLVTVRFWMFLGFGTTYWVSGAQTVGPLCPMAGGSF